MQRSSETPYQFSRDRAHQGTKVSRTIPLCGGTHDSLAYDFDELCEWIRWYEGLLSEYELGPTVDVDKIDPQVSRQCCKRFKTAT